MTARGSAWEGALDALHDEYRSEVWTRRGDDERGGYGDVDNFGRV